MLESESKIDTCTFQLFIGKDEESSSLVLLYHSAVQMNVDKHKLGYYLKYEAQLLCL